MVLLLLVFYVACFFYRFLVDLKWFKKWKKYVGFESYDVRFTGKREFFPGLIDNSALFKSMNFLMTFIAFYGICTH